MAYIPVLLALVVEMFAGKLGRPIVAQTGIVVNPNPSIIATVVIPIILPLVLALFLWLTGRRWLPSIAKNKIEG